MYNTSVYCYVRLDDGLDGSEVFFRIFRCYFFRGKISRQMGCDVFFGNSDQGPLVICCILGMKHYPVI